MSEWRAVTIEPARKICGYTDHFQQFQMATDVRGLNGFYASILTQIRLGLSNLRGQLFNYFLCDNPFCPLCFDAFESLDHFFLACKVLNIEKDVFMNRLKLLVPNVIQYIKVELMKLILTGVTVVGLESDICILKESIEFIKKSSGFTDRYRSTI